MERVNFIVLNPSSFAMVIDLFLIIVLAYGFYTGFRQGIIRTVFSILSLVLGLLAALRFTPLVTGLFEKLFGQTGALLLVVGFVTTFLLTLLLLRLVAKGLEGLMEKTHLHFVNQVIGGTVLASISAFFYSLILWFVVESVLTPRSQAVVSSHTYPFLRSYPGKVWAAVLSMKPLVGEFKMFSETILQKDDSETKIDQK